MGFVNLDIRVRYEDVDKNNQISIRGLLKYLVEAATKHSDMVGYGLNNIPQTHVSWLIINWRLKIEYYPKAGEAIHIRTWTRSNSKLYSFRDYEVLDNNGNRIVIASSKWVLINTQTQSVAKITPEIIQAYGPVDKSVFSTEIEKMKETDDTLYTNRFDYTIMRRDLDTNKHANNVNYVDLALEALPYEIYENITIKHIDVMYKKECLLGDKIACLYAQNEQGEHVVTIKSHDLKTLHAIIKMS